MDRKKALGLEMLVNITQDSLRQGSITPKFSDKLIPLLSSQYNPMRLSAMPLVAAYRQVRSGILNIYAGVKRDRDLLGEILRLTKGTLRETASPSTLRALHTAFEAIELGYEDGAITRSLAEDTFDVKESGNRDSLESWAQRFDRHNKRRKNQNKVKQRYFERDLQRILTLAYVCDLHRDEVRDERAIDHLLQAYDSLSTFVKTAPKKGAGYLRRTYNHLEKAKRYSGSSLTRIITSLENKLEANHGGLNIYNRVKTRSRPKPKKKRGYGCGYFVLGTAFGATALTAVTIFSLFKLSREIEHEILEGEVSTTTYSEIAEEKIIFNPHLKNLGIKYSDESNALGYLLTQDPNQSGTAQVSDNVVTVSTIYSPTPISLEGSPRYVDLQKNGTGQGLIISHEGHMIVPLHVITDNNDVMWDLNKRIIITQDKDVYEIEHVLATSSKQDLALVKTTYREDQATFQQVVFGDSGSLDHIQDYQKVSVRIDGGHEPSFLISPHLEIGNKSRVRFLENNGTGRFKGYSKLTKCGKGSDSSLFIDTLSFNYGVIPGDSGGLALDPQDRVIGINVCGSKLSATASPSNSVVELVREYLSQ